MIDVNSFVLNCMPRKRLLRLFHPPVLVYHAVGPIGKAKQQDIMPEGIFRRQLDFFAKNRYKVISPYELINQIVQGNKAEGNGFSVVLTFDDGDESFYSLVFPLLLQYKYPATLFLVPGKVGQQGYLSWSNIKEIAKSGLITFGNHTMTHVYLPSFEEEGLFYEIEHSRKLMEDAIGRSVDLLAYPWGGFNSYIKDRIRKNNYKAAFTTNQYADGKLGSIDLYALRRLTVSSKENSLRFTIKLSGAGYLFGRKMKKEGQLCL